MAPPSSKQGRPKQRESTDDVVQMKYKEMFEKVFDDDDDDDDDEDESDVRSALLVLFYFTCFDHSAHKFDIIFTF
jgi:hypothetical protein